MALNHQTNNPLYKALEKKYIADFEELCSDESFVVKKKVYLNRRGSSSWLANTFPNLFAAQAVYLIG